MSQSSVQLEGDETVSSDSRFRFRQAFRKGIDKIRNKKPENKLNENSNLDYESYDEAPDSENTKTRFRDKLKDAYRGVKDSVKASTKPSNFRPMYNFSSLPNSNEIHVKSSEETKNLIKSLPPSPESNVKQVRIPYKPGDNSYTKMIDLASEIISTGNYMRSGKNNHNYLEGFYNSYRYRPGEYADIKGSVCSNYLEFGGVVFGKYFCPVSGYSLASTECCGGVNEQFCCEPVCLQERVNASADRGKPRLFYVYILIFCFLLAFLVIMSVLVFIARKRIWKEKYAGVKDEEKEKEDSDSWLDD